MESSTRRIVASVAIIGFTAGIAAAALAFATDAPDTHALLLGKRPLDLHLRSASGVDGFLRGDNLAPGDRVRGGTLQLTASGASADTDDLDLAVDVVGDAALARALLLDRLSYGSDDLLSGRDGGRNLTAELDSDRDGWLRLGDLAAVNDLPPPRTSAAGGTAFVIDVLVDPRATGGISGEVRATFTFRLADKLDEDLRWTAPLARR